MRKRRRYRRAGGRRSFAPVGSIMSVSAHRFPDNREADPSAPPPPSDADIQFQILGRRLRDNAYFMTAFQTHHDTPASMVMDRLNYIYGAMEEYFNCECRLGFYCAKHEKTEELEPVE